MNQLVEFCMARIQIIRDISLKKTLGPVIKRQRVLRKPDLSLYGYGEDNRTRLLNTVLIFRKS